MDGLSGPVGEVAGLCPQVFPFFYLIYRGGYFNHLDKD